MELTQYMDGWIVPVRAQPNAKKNGVSGIQSDVLKVAVTAPPENGKANKALIEMLRKAFGVKRSHVKLISGEKSRAKKIWIGGLSFANMQECLAQVVDSEK